MRVLLTFLFLTLSLSFSACHSKPQSARNLATLPKIGPEERILWETHKALFETFFPYEELLPQKIAEAEGVRNQAWNMLREIPEIHQLWNGVNAITTFKNHLKKKNFSELTPEQREKFVMDLLTYHPVKEFFELEFI